MSYLDPPYAMRDHSYQKNSSSSYDYYSSTETWQQRAERRERAQQRERERAERQQRAAMAAARAAQQAFIKRQTELHEKYADRLMPSSFSHEKKGSSLDNMIPKSIPVPSFSLEQNQIKEIDKFENIIKNLLHDDDSDDDSDPGIGILAGFSETEKRQLSPSLPINKPVPITDKRIHNKIPILLGPRIFFNYAIAQQIFYNPESTFYWQCYWILLNVAKTYFQEALVLELENEAKAFDWLDKFHEQSLETRELRKVLDTFIVAYGEVFPDFKEKARIFLNGLFNGNQLLDSLLETIDKTSEAYYKSAPALRGLPLPPPQQDETATEAHYTLETLHSFLDNQEKKRYQEFVRDYLNSYPEEATYFQEAFQLGDVMIEQIPEILTEKRLRLSLNPSITTFINKSSDRWINEENKAEFRMHGAFLSLFYKYNDWHDLKKLISFYIPKNPADADFQQQMLIYCNKSHDIKRWKVIFDSLEETYRHPTRSLLEAVYEKTVLEKRGFFEPSYRLLEIADSCMKIAPEKMAPFFDTLPEKIAIFQPALFEEARKRSFLELLWLGSAILAKQAAKEAKSEATTSEDSFLSDGTPRFEEVDENGEPLNPVMHLKMPSNEDDENNHDELDDDNEETKTDTASFKSSGELTKTSNSTNSQYQSQQARQARQQELFLKILMQDEGEYNGWHKIQEILVDEAKKYQDMPLLSETSLSWKLWHGGSQSIKNANDLKAIGEKTLERPAQLVKEMDTLQKYFLKISSSSLQEGSLDTPIVIELHQLIEAMQDDALATLLQEEMRRVSPDEALVASRQSLFMRTFPSLFSEQRRQLYVKRAELGLAFQRSTEAMQALVVSDAFEKEANTSFNARREAKITLFQQKQEEKFAQLKKENNEAIAQLQQVQKEHEEELAQLKEAISTLQDEWNEWRGGLEQTTQTKHPNPSIFIVDTRRNLIC